MKWRIWALAVLCALVPATSVPAKPPATPAPPIDSRPLKPQSKLRPGSVLHADRPLPQEVDNRGQYERRRDRLVETHYTRMAELDVIADIARGEEDLALLEWVETVRRKEAQHFQVAMQHLRRESLARAMAVSP